MSSLYLALGLIGAFAAIVLAGLVLDARLAQGRRSVELLRAQVSEIPNLRQQELSQPFLQRVLVPFVNNLGRVVKQVTPVGMRQRIARKLVLAGSPGNWDAEKVAATKLFGAIGGGLLGLVLGTMAGLSANKTLFASVFLVAFGYLLPGAGLGQKAINRQDQIRKGLPDTMDLLTISVEAGLGFDAAVAHVRKNVPGPLSDELGRMLQEMQLGVPRADALRTLADRTDIDELKAFVLAMIQADIFGVSVAKVLRGQAKELRTKRRQLAEEKAMKVPVKLLFPLIFCILPAMFVVIIGPGIIRLVRTFLT
jgi:tight adherence protein C